MSCGFSRLALERCAILLTHSKEVGDFPLRADSTSEQVAADRRPLHHEMRMFALEGLGDVTIPANR